MIFCSISSRFSSIEKKILVFHSSCCCVLHTHLSWCFRLPRALNGVKKINGIFVLSCGNKDILFLLSQSVTGKRKWKINSVFPTILGISIVATLWIKEPNFPASYDQVFKQKAIILSLMFLLWCTAGYTREIWHSVCKLVLISGALTIMEWKLLFKENKNVFGKCLGKASHNLWILCEDIFPSFCKKLSQHSS